MKDPIHPAPSEFTAAQLSDDPILRYFHYAHLPPQLQSVSATFCGVAFVIVSTLPRNPERTVALRKLLEAKDAAVRANVPPAKPETFFDRLLREHNELHTRLTSLQVFIDSESFDRLPAEQKSLLIEQRTYMNNYREVLDARIQAIKQDDFAQAFKDARGVDVQPASKPAPDIDDTRASDDGMPEFDPDELKEEGRTTARHIGEDRDEPPGFAD